MADEYQVTTQALEVLESSASDAQIFAQYLEAYTSIEVGVVEVTTHYIEVVCSLTLLASRVPLVDDGVTDDVNPVSTFALYSAGYADDGDNDSGFPISHIGAKFTVKDVERNPFASRLPVDPKEQQETLTEQQRIIREQHNKAQAGDSTFDYGLLLKGETTKQFTLGSLGRFYHPDYGLLMARYVQFSQCVDSVVQGCPVGRLAKAVGVDWKVTNDYSKSGADLVLGVCFAAETPKEGSFGWAVVMGANLTQIGTNTAQVAAQNTEYSWSGLGELGTGVAGRIVARSWGKAIRSGIAAGQIFVTLETMSQVDFERETRRVLAAEILAVTDHENRLDVVEELLGTAAGQAADAATNYASLLARITQEAQTRAASDLELRSLISGASHDWSIEILSATNAVRTEFATADGLISIRVDTAQARADAAYLLAASINLLPLTNGLSVLSTRVSALEARVSSTGSGIWVPLTTGAIPAEFIVDDYGQCILVELIE